MCVSECRLKLSTLKDKNIAGWDRLVRVGAGGFLAGLAVSGHLVWAIFALVLLATGISGRCPAYAFASKEGSRGGKDEAGGMKDGCCGGKDEGCASKGAEARPPAV